MLYYNYHKETGGEAMNSKELKKLEQKYFKVKLNRLIDEQMILDEECHREVISSLNDMLIDLSDSRFIGFTNKPVMRGILLDIFPEMFFLQPDFGSEIYVCLLSYYDFLYTEKRLNKEEYVEMLLFFQMNMYAFFKKLAKASESMEADFSEVLEDFTINPGVSQSSAPKTKSKNNVIQMPGATRQQAVPKQYLQFRIDIEGFKPFIWRRVVVPNTITFETFHLVIQNLFEWENNHLHLFQTSVGGIGNLDSEAIKPSEKVLLSSVPMNSLSDMAYVYDFGEDWFHEIVLEKIIEEKEWTNSQEIYCVKAINDAPLDDSRMSGRMGHSTLKEINQRLASLKV